MSVVYVYEPYGLIQTVTVTLNNYWEHAKDPAYTSPDNWPITLTGTEHVSGAGSERKTERSGPKIE